MAYSLADFGVRARKELTDDYRVFYVTAWGYAADHLFGWFPKALNCHRDVFALLAHEGSRPKYLRERTRGERPPLVPFTEFLNDMGMTYAVIGDCYSYRAGQMPELLAIERYKSIPFVNLVRHPVTWLEFYVRWRSSNMRMRTGSSDPLAWEWKVSCHALFEYLGLKPYGRHDVEVWSSFQGMLQLNNVLGDLAATNRHVSIEHVADDPALFRSIVGYLGQGRVEFDQADLDRAYSMRHTLFRGEEPVETDPRTLLESWPGWKVDAFRKLVTADALDAYKSFGYDLFGLKHEPTVAGPRQVSRPIFVSSVMKSGTWLIRSILEMMTGLKAHEPELGPSAPDYEDESAIDFPPGTFFSWHSTLTPRSISLLRGCQAKNIFLIRNIYDVVIAMYRHLSEDVDASIGRSVVGSQYFAGRTLEQSLSLMINGFTSPQMTWHGMAPLIRQMNSMLDLVEAGQALLLSYEDLTAKKAETVQRLMQFLECWLSPDRVDWILAETDKIAMRNKAEMVGRGMHITRDEDKLSRRVFSHYHKEMVDLLVYMNAPGLPERLTKQGYDSIFRFENLLPQ